MPPELHVPLFPIREPSSAPTTVAQKVRGDPSTEFKPGTLSRYYRPELDVLRCLAFFLVLNHHTLPISFTQTSFRLSNALQESGAAGVCLFFTLSAFLITELLLREKEATGTIHIRAFYTRRILRIWPLYFLAIALSLILPHLDYHFQADNGLIAPYLLLVGNWAIVVHHVWPHSPMLNPLWSISVEEQFYLLWPALVLFRGARGIVAAALAVLPLAWALDLALPALHAAKDPQLWCNSFNQFQFFALGALLALSTHRRQLRLHAAGRVAALAAAFGCLLLSAYPFHFLNPVLPLRFGQTLGGYLSLDAACLLLFAAFLGAQVPRLARPLIYLGKISYGLYVFHFVVRLVVGNILEKHLHAPEAVQIAALYIVTAAVTILIASMSYHFFEKPFLRFKKRFTFVPSRGA